VQLRPDRDQARDLGRQDTGRLLLETREAVPSEVEEVPADAIRLEEGRLALGRPSLHLRSRAHPPSVRLRRDEIYDATFISACVNGGSAARSCRAAHRARGVRVRPRLLTAETPRRRPASRVPP